MTRATRGAFRRDVIWWWCNPVQPAPVATMAKPVHTGDTRPPKQMAAQVQRWPQRRIQAPMGRIN